MENAPSGENQTNQPAAPRPPSTANQPVPQSSQPGWRFQSEDPAPRQTSTASAESVSWTASEFIAHHKSAGWYTLLGVATMIIAGLVFLLTRDKISTGVVIFAAVVFGAYASRQPRTLEYHLDNGGLSIGHKFYGYEMFKSFAVMDEGAFASIVLLPLKRFMPSLSIYYAPEDEAKIVAVLAEHLPFEDRKRDVIDGLMRRIRF